MNRKRLLISLLIVTLLLSGCSGLTFLTTQLSSLTEKAAANTAPQTLPTITPTPLPTYSAGSLGMLEELQSGLAGVYAQVNPSVVNIQVVQLTEAPSSEMPQFRFFPFNAPDSQQPPKFRSQSLGSGFVWDKQGHIVTNNHVVDGADKITVTFSDGSSVDGELIGNDPDSDLAVVKVDLPEEKLHPIQVADSTQVRVGELAIAIGNPFGLQGTMTVGVISALGRSLPVQARIAQGLNYTIPDVIQTDAPINPGNSGGVLVNIHGQLIGVPTAIESPVRASAGIGFVIPSIIVQKVVPKLIEQGYYAHPWIGISGVTLNPSLAEAMGLDAEQRGVLVVDVLPDSPAEQAELRGSDRLTTIDEQEVRIGGDVITQIDSQPINDFEDLVAYLARYTEPDQTVTLSLLRDGKLQTATLTLGTRPSLKEEKRGSETISGRQGAWLGIRGATLTPEIAQAMGLAEEQQGVLVQQVVEGSPADEAGLLGSYKSVTIRGQSVLVGGDVITALDDHAIREMSELATLLQHRQPGDTITLSVLREGKSLEIEVTLAARP